MKKLLLSISCLLVSTFINAQAPNFEWAKQIGGVTSNPGNEYSEAIKVDALGNVYTAGMFQNTSDLDPSAATYTFTSLGGYDVYISKLDAHGNFMWAKHIGGLLDQRIKAITTDASGNLYATGDFRGTVDFDPGVGNYTLTATTAGADNFFILKLDANGNFMWAKQVDGYTDVRAITLDANNNIYTTGAFSGSLDFNPGPTTYTLNSAYGITFISKLDVNGDFVWAKQVGSNSPSIANSIKADNSGNIYITGKFSGSSTPSDFDPGVTTHTLLASGNDLFVLKLDANGNFIWVNQAGSSPSSTCEGNSISIDASGNVYTTGYIQGTSVYFGGSVFLYPNSYDAFIMKLSSTGSFSWVKQIGGNGIDQASSIMIDQLNNIYTSGYFSQTVDFDPSPNTYTLTTPSSSNSGYISKLDANGNFVWVQQITNGGRSTSYTGNNLLDLDFYNGIYTTGNFVSGTFDFDPSLGVFNLTSSGVDGYVLKLNQCYASPSAPINSTPSNNQMICANQTATLSVTTNSASVNWYASSTSTVILSNGLSLGTQTLAAGNYTYYAEASTCTVSATRTPITVTVNTLPTVNVVSSNTLLCTGQSAVLTASGTANTYTWNTSVNSASITVSPTITTNYTVIGTDANGCSNVSIITQSVSVCTNINDANLNAISIYPNPNNGSFIIQSSINLNLIIVNELGQVVKTISSSEIQNDQVIIDNLNTGIYFIQGTDGHNMIHQKIIITK